MDTTQIQAFNRHINCEILQIMEQSAETSVSLPWGRLGQYGGLPLTDFDLKKALSTYFGIHAPMSVVRSRIDELIDAGAVRRWQRGQGRSGKLNLTEGYASFRRTA